MNYKIGDLVTRISYKHDILFRIVDINPEVVFLKGVDVRLYADAPVKDLMKSSVTSSSDLDIIKENVSKMRLDRSTYFYIPGSVLHIDGDEEYLDRCMNFYKEMNIKANGICLNENDMPSKINSLLEEYNPDIVVITGHDAFYSRGDEYQNTDNFITCVREARKYEKSQDKLIIIAGACQSNYEALIRAGANFASSPKRINIHALDPAIVASSLALSDKNKSINLLEILEKTKYGSEGIGGIITNGTMYVGYPR